MQVPPEPLGRWQPEPPVPKRKFSEWLWDETRETAGISVKRLGRFLVRYLVEFQGVASEEAGGLLERDRQAARRISSELPDRQARHADV